MRRKWGRVGSTGDVSAGLQAEAPSTSQKDGKTIAGDNELALAA